MSVQRLETIIGRERLNSVIEELANAKLARVGVSEITAFDLSRHPDRSYRGAEYSVGRPQIKLEMLLEPHEVEHAVATLRAVLRKEGAPAPVITLIDVYPVVEPDTPSQPSQGGRRHAIVPLQRRRTR